MSTQNEVRQKITDQIIAALSDGTKLPPWRKPWRTDANAGHPTNVVSKRGYTGINPLLLDIAATRHDLKSKWWGTFRQWQGMGGMVKRRPVDVPPGEWGTNIIYFKRVAKKTTNEMGEDVEEKFFFMRTYTVFNLDQVDGLFSKLQVGNAPISVTEIEQRCEIAEAAIAATEADIRFGGDRAFYSLAGDFIQMPHRQQFQMPEYYETLFHELAHWTEHEKRLDWSRANSENSYAMGELIAELAGCYLAGELGLPNSANLTNHTSYLKSWLSGMGNDSRFIFRAAAQASKAVDFVLAFSRKEGTVTESEEAVLV